MSTHELHPVNSKITYEDRIAQFRQVPLLIWFTGLSGAGKTTIAVQLESLLFKNRYKIYLLDGDNVRKGLNKDLDFSEQGRNENIRRIAEVAKIMLDAGVIVIGAFISPLHKNRELIKETVGGDRYFEVFIDTPLEICEQRDTKGLYKKARSGELKNFTGIDAPYERPTRPDATILTTRFSPEESANLLLKAIEPRLKFS